MVQKEYEFRVNNYVERQWFRTITKVKIEENTLKISQIEDLKNVIKVYSNPTGVYKIDNIKDIKLSNIFLIYNYTIIVLIVMTLLFITEVFIFSTNKYTIIIYSIFLLICIFCSKAKGIKIILKDNRKLYIPVAALRFESIEYKKDIVSCITNIKKRII